MRWVVASVGRPRDRHLQAAAEPWLKRLRSGPSLDLVHVREGSGSVDDVRRAESEALRQKVRQVDRVVVLDERGELVTSEALAGRLDAWALAGSSRVGFLLGGAFGHDASLRDGADWVWSLSPLTFPHELARVVLIEQLYRAWTIQRGEPYHKR